MKKLLLGLRWLVLGAVVLPGLALAQPSKPDVINVAVVTFVSGSGAVVGGPSVNSAKLTIDQINAAGGINGVPIKVNFYDEAGGASKNIATFRQVADTADVVIGYVSSSDCLAVAQVAEELEVPTIFSACTTNSLFQGNDYQWSFRTQPPASANALAAALYIAKTRPDIDTIAGINPDYAFGHDQWTYFTAAISALMPDVEFVTPLFPKLFSGRYSSQITRLLATQPDLIYSSLWGGDLVAFIQQGEARGLFKSSEVLLTLGTQAGLQGLKALPDGVISSSEHSYLFHPGDISNSDLATFADEYRARFGHYPVSTYPYTMRRSFLALHAGYEAAIAANNGQWPSKQQFVAALEGLTVDTLMGPMVIRDDHQATYHEMMGVSTHTPKYPFAVFNEIVTFPAHLIMPPPGTKNVEKWISSLTRDILEKVPEPKAYSSK